jgi:hypothetical protein
VHPQINGQVECVNELILQVMKIRMFYDLKTKGRNWYKELPSVLWILRTNINRATIDILFHLVYEANIVLLSKIYLETTRVV